MTKKRPKTTDALMRYLREEKGISISGSSQKRKLMNIGYYHGYKGYRFFKSSHKKLPFVSYAEIYATIQYDAQLKALFYPYVMQIETALKSYVLEVVVSQVNSDSFIDVYNKLLDNYKAFSTAGSVYSDFKQRKKAEDKFKYELKRRLDLRNRIYKVQTDAFGNGNKIAEHYLNNDMNLPIWAIYELLSLGEFGHFVSCLNFPCRQAISSKLGIRASDDSNALLPQRLIYVIKDLRNAIAHNDVVFDTRFRTNKIDRQVCNATNVPNLNFETITDYLVLIVYLLSLLRISKNDSKRLISSYIECTERLRKAIPANVYSQIIRTDNSSKVVALRKFI